MTHYFINGQVLHTYVMGEEERKGMRKEKGTQGSMIVSEHCCPAKLRKYISSTTAVFLSTSLIWVSSLPLSFSSHIIPGKLYKS